MFHIINILLVSGLQGDFAQFFTYCKVIFAESFTYFKKAQLPRGLQRARISSVVIFELY
jgi:hypothetical protein